MTEKFHWSPTLGGPVKCDAKKMKCPLRSNHFDSREEAYSWFEEKMNKENSGSSLIPAPPTPADEKTHDGVFVYDNKTELLNVEQLPDSYQVTPYTHFIPAGPYMFGDIEGFFTRESPVWRAISKKMPKDRDVWGFNVNGNIIIGMRNTLPAGEYKCDEDSTYELSGSWLGVVSLGAMKYLNTSPRKMASRGRFLVVGTDGMINCRYDSISLGDDFTISKNDIEVDFEEKEGGFRWHREVEY